MQEKLAHPAVVLFDTNLLILCCYSITCFSHKSSTEPCCHGDLWRYARKVIVRIFHINTNRWYRSTHDAILHVLRKHDDDPRVLLPDHAPEVRDGVVQRCLARDVVVADVARALKYIIIN
jgi:hypothetical protein